MNAVIKYPGSKWRIAKWILDFFPPHHSYLEPFFGSGAVLFSKNRSDIETINDLDGEVVNFFDWVRNDPERLAKAIYMTPYSRDVYERTKKQVKESDFERAVRFCIETNTSHGFKTDERSGWKIDIQGRERAYAAVWWGHMPEKIMVTAERLRGVQIDNRPAVDVIQRFSSPKVLIYCDPPYVLSTRHKKMYRMEMTDADHEELLETLKRHKGPAMVSGYDHPMYNAILRDWHREETGTYNQLAQARQEVLWMNFDPPQRQMVLEGSEG